MFRKASEEVGTVKLIPTLTDIKSYAACPSTIQDPGSIQKRSRIGQKSIVSIDTGLL